MHATRAQLQHELLRCQQRMVSSSLPSDSYGSFSGAPALPKLIIFDKDGTLVTLSGVWSAWPPPLARLPPATPRALRRAVSEAMHEARASSSIR